MNSREPQAANDNTDPKKYRINNVSAGLMLLLAILSDLTGPFGAVIGGGSILICQYLMGVPPISFKPKQAVKKTINLLGNAVGEAATAGIFPSITVYTAFTIAWARLEDKTGISIPNPGTTKKPTNMRQLRGENDNEKLYKKAS